MTDHLYASYRALGLSKKQARRLLKGYTPEERMRSWEGQRAGRQSERVERCTPVGGLGAGAAGE